MHLPPEGDVRPENNITRAEVATIFFRIMGDESRDKYASSENVYTDVNAGDWYNNAISTVSNAGIVNGYEDGTFKPDAPIKRSEFATIAARFIGGKYQGDDRFSDIAGHWAAEYINRASKYGWINGYEDGTFKPDRDITRAEAMTLVNSVLTRGTEARNMHEDMVIWTDNTEDKWYYEEVQEATNAHNYTKENNVETWTEMRENRDWKALEIATFTPGAAVEEDAEEVTEEVTEETVTDETADETTEATDETVADET
ncbi:MAG: S-layer homology domain-containing protein, partial [Lachnospiraceae bacterium]|nr:S-layer homology domain-containing protein [Lachnospiraceae bacterium]